MPDKNKKSRPAPPDEVTPYLATAPDEPLPDRLLRATFGLRLGPCTVADLRAWFHSAATNDRVRVRFALQCIDHDDGHTYYKRQYETPNLLPIVEPDRTRWAGWVFEGLTDPDGGWRATAVKWLPSYSGAVVPHLTAALTDPYVGVRWWAAVHLADLAPATPGVAVVLDADLAEPGVVPLPDAVPTPAVPAGPLPLRDRTTPQWDGYPVWGRDLFRSYSAYTNLRHRALQARERLGS